MKDGILKLRPKGVDGCLMTGAIQDHFVGFRLMTILTGQSYISKVNIFCCDVKAEEQIISLILLSKLNNFLLLLQYSRNWRKVFKIFLFTLEAWAKNNTFLFSKVSSNHLQEKTQSHIGCICMTDLHCVFHMLPQCTRIRAGIVPLVAFVWLFSTAQCAVCTVSFPRNRTRWDMTSHSTIVISFNIFFPQLVRLRGKHFYEHFCDLQTLNLWFSLNYTPVSTTEFWRFMPQFLSKYMGILLSPRIIYRAILNTGGSYCTNSTLCSAATLTDAPRIWSPTHWWETFCLQAM